MKNLLIVLFLLIGGLGYGQTFERFYGEGEGSSLARTVIQGVDGNYYACGNDGGNGTFLLKTNELGVEEWIIHQDTINANFTVIRQISQNRLIIGGSLSSLGSTTFFDRPILIMYDTDGNEIWEYDFNFEQEASVEDIEIDTEGNIIVLIALEQYDTPDIEEDYAILTINDAGELISEYTHTNTEYSEYAYDILLLEDGGYLIISQLRYETGPTIRRLSATKLNTNFEVAWIFIENRIYIEEEIAAPGSGDLVVELDDGTLFIAYSGIDGGAEDNEFYLKVIALSANGEFLWDKIPLNPNFGESPSLEFPYSLKAIQKIDNESIILVGEADYVYMFGSGSESPSNLSLIKIDTQGDIIWNKKFGGPSRDEGHWVSVTSDGGFVIAGQSTTNPSFYFTTIYLIRTDSEGNVIKNNLNGTIVFDENENCVEDNEEIGLQNWLVIAAAEGNIYYDITDTSGIYELDVDNGNYDVFISPPNQYWNSCETLFNTGDLEDYDTLNNDFHVRAVVDCPLMHVDVSTPFLRRCFDGTYLISYSNQGTLPATDAYIEVSFDDGLEITGSTPPWSNQNGQTLTFDLATVEVSENGTIQVDVTVGCDDEGIELGQIHCVEAHIYPDTICAPDNPSWDGSDIIVNADCENDSIRFFIRNIGDGNMNNEQEYIIIEDHIILFQEPFQLPAGSEIEIPVPTNGIAYRLEAEQSIGHPIGNMPSINIEGCNLTGANDFILGFWNAYPEDDVANFVSIDCQSNIGSYDPNDKRSQPAGYGEEHFIAQNTDIEYHIRFQNTGTDTAFTVVVEDVLSLALDITSVVPGASSHPYEFDIDNGRKLKFTFNDILLVDSTTNEVASNGFIKFKVSQMSDNPMSPPTFIYNDAKIFFDFNAPITTNEAWLTVGENFIQSNITSTFSVKEEEKHVLIHPNPFSEETIFTVMGAVNKPLEFTVFDIQGRELRRETHRQNSFKFLRKELAEGLYFYRIETEGKLLDTGKIVIR